MLHFNSLHGFLISPKGPRHNKMLFSVIIWISNKSEKEIIRLKGLLISPSDFSIKSCLLELPLHNMWTYVSFAAENMFTGNQVIGDHCVQPSSQAQTTMPANQQPDGSQLGCFPSARPHGNLKSELLRPAAASEGHFVTHWCPSPPMPDFYREKSLPAFRFTTCMRGRVWKVAEQNRSSRFKFLQN